MVRFSLFAVTALVAFAPQTSHAIVYDWVAGIDLSHNPSQNGPWSYGSTDTLGSDFVPSRRSNYRTHLSEVVFLQWLSDNHLANIEWNTSDVFMEDGGGGGRPANSMTMHPGSGDQYAVLRFTAPVADNYDINVAFTGNSNNITTTDVHVLVNGASIFDGVVNSTRFIEELGEGPSFENASPIALQAGGTIDIAVGSGGNGYGWDLTGVYGFIESSSAARAIPEPSGAALAAWGLAWWARRRRERR